MVKKEGSLSNIVGNPQDIAVKVPLEATDSSFSQIVSLGVLGLPDHIIFRDLGPRGYYNAQIRVL